MDSCSLSRLAPVYSTRDARYFFFNIWSSLPYLTCTTAYRLYTVVPRLVTFIGQLTNWYVRLNRRRLKASDKDAQVALNILFEVLLALAKAMTPFTPFFTEFMYQNLRFALPEAQRQDSIHYEMFPEPRAEALNARIEEAVSRMQVWDI